MRSLPIVALLVLPLGGPLMAQDLAPEDDRLDPGNWPLSVRQAVPVIIARLTEKQRDQIKAMRRDDLIMLHHEWGMDIRNYLGLWRGNNQLILSACKEPCHPDDASTILMQEAWSVLNASAIKKQSSAAR